MNDTKPADKAPDDGVLHHTTETIVADYEKMIVAAQPIVAQVMSGLSAQRQATEEALTQRVRLAEAEATRRSWAAGVTLAFVGAVVCALAGAALYLNQAGIAEKIVFGLFAFAGGLAARR